MKCRLLQDAKGPNPEYNAAAHEIAIATDQPYDTPREIVKPAGTIIEHRDAHYLCAHGPNNTPPLAEPVDDECKKRTAVHLLHREAGIRRLRAMVANPPKDRKQAAAVMEMAKDYGIGRG